MKGQVAITAEIGMLGLGLFLLIGHVVDPSQYGTGVFALSEILMFFGLLFGLGSNFSDLGFGGAFVITIIFIVVVNLLIFHFV